MPNYLVIKTSSLGDILQTLPAVLSLKKAQPDASIHWVVEKRFVDVLKPFPIDRLIIADFKTWKKKPFESLTEIVKFINFLREVSYDMVIDFQANTKSGLVMALAKGIKRSFKTPAEWPHRLFKAMRIDPKMDNCLNYYHSLVKDIAPHLDYDLPSIDQVFKGANGKKIITLGLGSMWPSKKPCLEKVKALMKELSQDPMIYFLIPALENDKATYQKLLDGFNGEVIVKESIMQYLPELLASQLFIGADSALLHLCRLFKIPSKGLFGPSSARFYGQTGDFQGSCPYGVSFEKRCPRLRTCSAPCLKGTDVVYDLT